MVIYQPGLSLPFHLGMHSPQISPEAAVTQLGMLIKDALRIVFSAALSISRSRICTASGAAGRHCPALSGISPPTCSLACCALRAAPAKLTNLQTRLSCLVTRPFSLLQASKPPLATPAKVTLAVDWATPLPLVCQTLPDPGHHMECTPASIVTGSVDVSFHRL
ncbi:hypothetical protein FKM82_020006 [Ascaphus truei]